MPTNSIELAKEADGPKYIVSITYIGKNNKVKEYQEGIITTNVGNIKVPFEACATSADILELVYKMREYVKENNL